MSSVRGPDDVELHASPADRVGALVRLIGEAEVARWCGELLVERVPYDADERPSSTWLGGAHAVNELERGDIELRGQAYWFRTWAARGLLYAWTPEVAPEVCSGLGDAAWRVREMCAKVARLRELGEAAPLLAGLVDDSVPRVRAAAAAALAVTAEADEVPALRRATDDPEASVRSAAQRALERVAVRLDRPL